jgi:hypothetical protein
MMLVHVRSATAVSVIFYLQTFLASWALCRVFFTVANLRRRLTESFLAREAGLMPLGRYFCLKGRRASPWTLFLVASLLVQAFPPLLWQSVDISTTVDRTTQFIENLKVNATWQSSTSARDNEVSSLDQACTGFVVCDFLNKMMARSLVGPPEVLAASPSMPFDHGSGLQPMELNYSYIFDRRGGYKFESWAEILQRQRLFTLGNVEVLSFYPGPASSFDPLQDRTFLYTEDLAELIKVGVFQGLGLTSAIMDFQLSQGVATIKGVGQLPLLAAGTHQTFQVM